MLKMQALADEVAGVGGNSDVEKYAKRIQNIENEEADLKQDKKEIYTEAKAGGVDVKALRVAIRAAKKERDLEHIITVNAYLEKMGESPLFSVGN